MDFGKVANPDKVDFTFPPDHEETTALLAARKAERGIEKPQIYVGCAKWSRSDWVGKFYPKGSKPGQFLSLYAKNFNSVELNATFHRMPDPKGTGGWAVQTAEDFRFCPKIHQSITHWRRLKGTERETEQFLRGIDGFGSRLGTIFLQLPPNFSPTLSDTLQVYLERFPTDQYNLAVEFRHPDWFGDKKVYDDTFALLGELEVGAVITDTSGRRDVLHQRLTTPDAFVRFVGNNLHPSDYRRLDDWAARIRAWIDQGIRRLNFFIHHPDELYTPKLVTDFIRILNERCGLSLKVPELLEEPPSLFE